MYANISVTLVGFPLAVARRALDEFTELARTKSRGPERLRIADDRYAQVQFAAAEGGLQSARAFAFDVIGEAWDTACARDPSALTSALGCNWPPIRQRGRRSRRWTACSAQRVERAVYADQLIQRRFRHLHARIRPCPEARSRDSVCQVRAGVAQPPHLSLRQFLVKTLVFRLVVKGGGWR